MQKKHFLPFLIFSLTILSLKANSCTDSSLYLNKYDYLIKVDEQIQKRWEKVKEIKENFAPYTTKSNEEIISEFQQLNTLRKHLWHSDPNQFPLINNEDYAIASQLLNLTIFPRYPYLIAFNYNYVDDSYNASTIFLYGYHFIALEEPMQETLDAFFTLLINKEVSILVRLKPEGEYADRGSLSYWKDRIIQGPDYPFIQLNSTLSQFSEKNIAIPYFHINEWVDNKGIDIANLYNLVQEVRHAYKDVQKIRPMACHCAAGVGRTGTFIAAFIIANLLDLFEPNEISIEEIVLKLSIQRSRMVTTVEQYLTLYKFVDYYLEMKNKVENDLEAIEF